MSELKQPSFRTQQLLKWLYGEGVTDYALMTNLPKTFREELGHSYPINAPRIVDRQTSVDGTRKYLLEYQDGALVETVAIPSGNPLPAGSVQAANASSGTGINARPGRNSSSGCSTKDGVLRRGASEGLDNAAYGASRARLNGCNRPNKGKPADEEAERTNTEAGEEAGEGIPDERDVSALSYSIERKATGRLTVCVSTQAGCAMACSFCATGKEGFLRNLLPGEIVDQVLVVQSDMSCRVSNIVTMGQGEPFLNYAHVLAALHIMNNPNCLAIGARHITLSTCGIIKGIKALAKEPEQFTLAVSLHSAVQKTRNKLMPKLASEPLPELRKAIIEYIRRTNRRVSLEYVMLDGVNDSPSDLDALKHYCVGLLCHVNLIPFNSIVKDQGEGVAQRKRNDQLIDPGAFGQEYRAPQIDGFRPSPSTVLDRWTSALEADNIPTTVRNSRGSDIAGACGQLKNTSIL
ncbi:MAG: 23S rRNA (adenine(2503)-C(2))-methyltransferase RlmN [Coriobacteriaceae bacterium]|nr:23S rRNA (adenine(2503)-C(2))-methyltransferase RlmN [Coriobacteriaceae bacterium]